MGKICDVWSNISPVKKKSGKWRKGINETVGKNVDNHQSWEGHRLEVFKTEDFRNLWGNLTEGRTIFPFPASDYSMPLMGHLF